MQLQALYDPLIKRLSFSTEPIITLNYHQVTAVAKFRHKIHDKAYAFIPNPCLCGSKESILVACRDRYGLDVRTKLCRSCGLLRTDPYFDMKSLARFYEVDYRPIYMGVDQPSGDFFDQQVRHGQRIIKFMKEVGVSPVGCVVEVGCGSGGILKAFQQTGCRVAGCDLGDSFLEYGRQQGLVLECGDVSSLVQYAPADIVILSHVLEHFRHPLTKLGEIKSLLAPGGFLYVEVPGLFWLEKSYQSDLGRYLQNAHVYHFCLESLDYVMSLAGFTRVAGNEKISAIYRPTNPNLTKSMPPDNLSRKIELFLRRLEWLRIYRYYRTHAINFLIAIYRRIPLISFVYRKTIKRLLF